MARGQVPIHFVSALLHPSNQGAVMDEQGSGRTQGKESSVFLKCTGPGHLYCPGPVGIGERRQCQECPRALASKFGRTSGGPVAVIFK